MQKLQELKDLTGHSSLETIFDQALDALLLSEKKKRGVIQKKINRYLLGARSAGRLWTD